MHEQASATFLNLWPWP